ncbi:MAG TPA: class I SAM-dependent methyltransferase, partial [Bacillota bacterium]|nr:class I SAM-dependent methyltransferase [Bacillota bacterium]
FREFHRILKLAGKLLVVVKEGQEEGYQSDLLGYETPIYFSLFGEGELKRLFEDNGFRITYFETRKPYDFEIQVSRIYVIGEKL